MAKGLRSKSQRKNRTLLRKTLTIPLIEKRQEELAASLKAKLNEQNGSTIAGLKTLLSKKSKNGVVSDVKNTDPAVESEREKATLPPKTINVHLIKNRGMKPKKNPNKPLVWFK